MLARHGLDVDLFVPRSEAAIRAAGADRRASIRSFYGSDTDLLPDNVRLVDVWNPPFARGDLRRAVHDVLAPFRARARRYDLVYTRDLYALGFTLALGIPSIFETYRTDINEFKRFGAFRRFAYTHRRLIGVVTHSRLARDYFERAGVESERLLVAHNGYSPSVMQPMQTMEESRSALGLALDRPLVCYTGHVNPKKGVDILVKIASGLPDVSFLVVGAIPGSEEERAFNRLVEDAGVSNVQVLPRVPPASIATYLYAADCLIIPPASGPLQRFRRTVLPMKTYLYMAAGRAIVAPDLPDQREILSDGVNASLVVPDDVPACVMTIRGLIADDDLRRRLGSRAQQDASSYTWEARAGKIATFIRARTVQAV
jgi:glycosyltransferase involved in cell wall biosynthesis